MANVCDVHKLYIPLDIVVILLPKTRNPKRLETNSHDRPRRHGNVTATSLRHCPPMYTWFRVGHARTTPNYDTETGSSLSVGENLTVTDLLPRDAHATDVHSAVYAAVRSLSVCSSVTRTARYGVETVDRIELIFNRL